MRLYTKPPLWYRVRDVILTVVGTLVLLYLWLPADVTSEITTPQPKSVWSMSETSCKYNAPLTTEQDAAFKQTCVNAWRDIQLIHSMPQPTISRSLLR